MDKKHRARKKALMDMKKKKSEYSDGGIAAQVVAKDPKSLKEGLKKAADVVEEKEDMLEDMGEEMDDDCENMSRDELLEYIKKMKRS